MTACEPTSASDERSKMMIDTAPAMLRVLPKALDWVQVSTTVDRPQVLSKKPARLARNWVAAIFCGEPSDFHRVTSEKSSVPRSTSPC